MQLLDDPRSERLARLGLNEPLGYVDGMNQYQLERSSPLDFTDPSGLAGAATRPTGGAGDVFDNPSDGPLDRIGEQAGGLGWVFQQLNQHDQDLTGLFVKTQIAILNALAKGDCPCINDQEKQWLMNTVRDFIRPLAQSLSERSQKPNYRSRVECVLH